MDRVNPSQSPFSVSAMAVSEQDFAVELMRRAVAAADENSTLKVAVAEVTREVSTPILRLVRA